MEMVRSMQLPNQGVHLFDTWNANDDICLKKVFQQLDLKDLTNVAGVCTHFKRQAEDVFKSKWSKLNLNIFHLMNGDVEFFDGWYKLRHLYQKFLKFAEQFFRNFGKYIELLTLQGVNIDQELKEEHELLKLVKKYCRSLTELTLVGICGNGLVDEFFGSSVSSMLLAN